MAFIGIGSILPEKSTPYKAGYISLQQARELVKRGLLQTYAAAASSRMATGEDKVSSICSAAKGGFITTLITDEVTAIAILGTENAK